MTAKAEGRRLGFVFRRAFCGEVCGDLELLAGKNAGTSLAWTCEQLFPDELGTLNQAAVRLGLAPTWTAHVLRQTLR